MLDLYPQIKLVHVAAVMLSGALFALRGSLMLARSPLSHHAVLRRLSYAIDTALLTAALMLATILHQYPFVHAWLTVKVLLLVLYIVLGTVALKRGSTYRTRAIAFGAALCVFAFIVSVALAHHPLGVFAALMR
jgi:uncharacterized membrane protein SirB2